MFYSFFSNIWYLPLILCFSFVFTYFFTKCWISLLKTYSKFQPVRDYVSSKQMQKKRTPTMGGLIINISILINILLWCDISSQINYIIIFIIVGTGIIGFVDDAMKVFLNSTFGFRGSVKLILELLIALIAILWTGYTDIRYLDSSLLFPFFGWVDFGIITLPLLMIAMAGSSNATNITDGMDGLLTIPVLIISIIFTFLIILFSNGINLANNSTFIVDKELLNNLLIITLTCIGSFSAFLKFNLYPARVFMGDVGSLMIGALLFFISFLLKIELLYAIMGLLFIVELASTAIQSTSYIFFDKPVFKIAPLHHHFEKLGWEEKKIVKVFTSFCLLVCFIGLFIFFL